jgi:hypothetical protein
MIGSCSNEKPDIIKVQAGDIVEHRLYECLGVVMKTFEVLEVAIVGDYLCQRNGSIIISYSATIGLNRLRIVTSEEKLNKYFLLLKRVKFEKGR